MKSRNNGACGLRRKPRRSLQEFYHLTPARNVQAIRECGLVAQDGKIFLFTDMIVADVIAKTQVGIVDRYAVFAVSPQGVTGELKDDEVAEFSRPFQRVLRQNSIGPEHLRFAGEFDVAWGHPTEWDYLRGERLGFPRKYVEARARWEGRLVGAEDAAEMDVLMDQMLKELDLIRRDARNPREKAH